MLKLILSSLSMSLVVMGLILSGANAAEMEPAGKKLFIKNKCQQCHTVQAIGIAKDEDEEEEEEVEEGEEKVDPPDLSAVGKERKVEWVVKWMKKEEKNKGRKHKKKWKGSEEDLKVLSDWLVTLKHDVPKK